MPPTGVRIRPGLDVQRVRGTKNPDRGAIKALRPDLVVANKEENRRLDVERLREDGLNVWVTDIESVEQAFTSLTRLFQIALATGIPPWLAEAQHAWSQPTAPTGRRAVIAVWRDPWMVVGSRTFAGDVLRRLGLVHVFADHPDRYPHVELDEIRAQGAEVVILPDEPYAFSDADGPEAFAPGQAVVVPGRLLTWYGPSLTEARTTLGKLLNRSEIQDQPRGDRA